MINSISEYSYSSTQFNLESPYKEDVQQFVTDVIDPLDILEDSIPYHITIKYGIHDLFPNALAELVKEIPPVKTILSKVTFFDTADNYDVLKIDVLSQDLRKLNKLISDNLACTDTFLSYQPHITLAYLVKGTAQKYSGNAHFYGRQMTFDKIVFSPSEGADSVIYLKGVIK